MTKAENEVRSGVVMTDVILFYLQEVNSSVMDMLVKFLPPCLIWTRTATSENDKPCGVFVTPGLTSSSNGERTLN